MRGGTKLRVVAVWTLFLCVATFSTNHVTHAEFSARSSSLPKILKISSTKRGKKFDLRIRIQHGRTVSSAKIRTTRIVAGNKSCSVAPRQSSCLLKSIASGVLLKISVSSQFDQSKSLRGKAVTYRVGANDWPTAVKSPTTTIPASLVGRTYSTFGSTGTASSPVPMVVLLHGYGSNGSRQSSYMNLPTLAESKQFLLVAPDGTLNPRGERFWNAGEICCDFFNSKINDEQFLTDLVSLMTRKHHVDARRIYLVGHSNGGAMAYRMACRHPSLFAGLVSLAGIGQDDVAGCARQEPVGILHIHGTADAEVNYLGGLRYGKPYVSATELSSRWATMNGCAAPMNQISTTYDLVRNVIGSETRVSTWGSCTRGVLTQLWTIEGGNHVPSLTPEFSPLVYSFLLLHSK